MNAHLPAPLISENEGKHQNYYPEYNDYQPSNDYFYKPRTFDELEESIWIIILDGIRKEIKCRCKDGIKPLIDEYIAVIGDFMRI